MMIYGTKLQTRSENYIQDEIKKYIYKLLIKNALFIFEKKARTFAVNPKPLKMR